MRPVAPPDVAGIHQLEINLVHQFGGLERAVATLLPHIPVGQAAELFVNERHQGIESCLIASAPCLRQAADFHRRSVHPRRDGPL
jgi:hypothetical protein